MAEPRERPSFWFVTCTRSYRAICAVNTRKPCLPLVGNLTRVVTPSVRLKIRETHPLHMDQAIELQLSYLYLIYTIHTGTLGVREGASPPQRLDRP